MTYIAAARYRPLKTQSSPFAHEVESTTRQVVHVTLSWGDSILFTGEVDTKRGFTLGDGVKGGAFALPSDLLADGPVPLVRFVSGVPLLCVPRGATVRSQRGAEPATMFPPNPGDAHDLPLPPGARVELDLGAIRIAVEHGPAGKSSERQGLWPEPEVLTFYGLSFGCIGALLSAMAYFLPPLGLTASEDSGNEQLYLIQQYLEANALREEEREAGADDGEEGDQRDPMAAGSERLPGDGQPSPSGKVPYAPKRQLERTAQIDSDTLQTARVFGMVGLLQTLGTEATAAGWVADVSEITGQSSGLWGDELGDIADGLRLSGNEQGSGGPGTGVDLGGITGLGGPLPGGDFGPRIGRPGAPGHKTKVPSMRVPHVDVSGHLPAEVIQRTVRQNFGRFRLCYEQGLLKNPNLQGRVEVRFLIGRDGGVTQAMQGASDLPDAKVTSCIVGQFYGLSFPAPEHGTVRVTYPLVLSPG